MPYTKDVRLEVLAPEEIMEESKAENKDPDSYPYSDMQVTLRRYMLEIETLGPIRNVEPGDWLEHTELWSLNRDVTVGEWTDEALDGILSGVKLSVQG